MSNAIANSFALLNEIRQELNSTKANIRMNRSPSPKKVGLSSASTLAPLRVNNTNPIKSTSFHKTNKYATKPYEKSVDSVIDRYSSDNYDENLQVKKKKLYNENYESVKNEAYDKNSDVQSSEILVKLKEKIDNEIKTFSESCDEITAKINELIKNIDDESNQLKEKKIIDEESSGESDEENYKPKKKNQNKSKEKYDIEEKNIFKSLNDSFNKIVQNLDNKKYDYMGRKLNS